MVVAVRDKERVVSEAWNLRLRLSNPSVELLSRVARVHNDLGEGALLDWIHKARGREVSVLDSVLDPIALAACPHLLGGGLVEQNVILATGSG